MTNTPPPTTNNQQPTTFSFIGMSGVGKSHWARQLAQRGWLHLDCDRAIAERLGELIDIADGEDPVHAVGRWMGMPWSPGYAEREAQYLALEQEVTADALDTAAAQPPGGRVVLDTTGSVIYTGKAIIQRLRAETRVVYFDAPPEVRERMVELYLREPKPVLWQGGYLGEGDGPLGSGLEASYARLLSDRAARYRAAAHSTLDYHALRADGFTVERLLERLG